MISLDREQCKELAKALYNLGNIVFAAMVVGQFVASARFRIGVFVAGLVFFILVYTWATLLTKEA